MNSDEPRTAPSRITYGLHGDHREARSKRPRVTDLAAPACRGGACAGATARLASTYRARGIRSPQQIQTSSRSTLDETESRTSQTPRQRSCKAPSVFEAYTIACTPRNPRVARERLAHERTSTLIIARRDAALHDANAKPSPSVVWYSQRTPAHRERTNSTATGRCRFDSRRSSEPAGAVPCGRTTTSGARAAEHAYPQRPPRKI